LIYKDEREACIKGIITCQEHIMEERERERESEVSVLRINKEVEICGEEVEVVGEEI
jgi:hypothetical protein